MRDTTAFRWAVLGRDMGGNKVRRRRIGGCLWAMVTILWLLNAGAAAGQDSETTPGLLERVERLEVRQNAEALWKTMGMKLSGYVDAAYTQNFNNPASGVNQLHIFDTDADGFMPHMAQLIIERPGEAGPSLLDRAGFRARLDFGLDARVTKARTNPAPGTSNDEFDLQELFAQYIVPVGNGLNVQFGKINTLIGYETIQSWENPNFSRSFMFGLGQAFTTTGLRVSYQFNPFVQASVGVINGWDNVDNNTRGKSIEYLLALTPTKWLDLSFYGSYGPERPTRAYGTPLTSTTSDQLAMGAILAVTLTENTEVIFEPYYVNETNNPAQASNPQLKPNARWNGIATYLIHDFTPQWSFRLRGEIFEDAGGSRTCGGTLGGAGGANTCFGATTNNSAPAIAQTLWEFTPTLQYKPVPPLITRLEFRYDKSNKNVFQYGSSATNHQETLNFEVMYLF